MQVVELLWNTVQGELGDQDVQSELYQGISGLEEPLVIIFKGKDNGPARLFENLVSVVAGTSEISGEWLVDAKIAVAKDGTDPKLSYGALTVMSKLLRNSSGGKMKRTKPSRFRKSDDLLDQLTHQKPEVWPSENFIIINRDMTGEVPFHFGIPELVLYGDDSDGTRTYKEASHVIEDLQFK